MTSITAKTVIDERTGWFSRRSIAAFVAGAILATGAALGVTTGLGADAPTVSAPRDQAADGGCVLLRGPC